MSVRTFLLPDLGEGLTEAELVTWLVKEGEVIAVDQPVAEVETAKSLVEVPSPYAGTVAQLHGAAGETIDVGRPLISVAEPGTAVPDGGPATAQAAGTGTAGETAAGAAEASGAAAASAVSGAAGSGTQPDPATPEHALPSAGGDAGAAGEAYRQEERAGSGNVLIGYGTPGGHGQSRRSRRPKYASGTAAGNSPAAAPGSASSNGAAAGAAAPAAAADPSPAPQPSPPAVEAPRCISPIVRRLARDNGLRLADLTGSGPDGLILRRDVEQALSVLARAGEAAAGGQGPEAPVEAVAAARPADAGGRSAAAGSDPGTAVTDARSGLGVTRTPVRGVRKAVAANLAASRREIPEATVWVDVDATALLELRADLKKRHPDSTPGLMAFLARFALAGLARFPELNTRWEDKDGGAEIAAFDGVNLGFAAQTDRGLVVPSIRRADTMNARQLDAEIRRLTAAARAGKASPAELTSGTFTLNNYGVFGVDGSAAIINHPESAILGIGRIIDKPWVVDGQLAVRKVTELTLAFDHRVCDGGTAGGFLRYVADAVENPGSVLADL